MHHKSKKKRDDCDGFGCSCGHYYWEGRQPRTIQPRKLTWTPRNLRLGWKNNSSSNHVFFRVQPLGFPRRFWWRKDANTNCRFKGTSNSFKYRCYRVEQRYFSMICIYIYIHIGNGILKPLSRIPKKNNNGMSLVGSFHHIWQRPFLLGAEVRNTSLRKMPMQVVNKKWPVSWLWNLWKSCRFLDFFLEGILWEIGGRGVRMREHDLILSGSAVDFKI